MILQRLLGVMPVAEFLARHYLQVPFARPGGCHDLTPLGGWETVEQLLAQPDADVLVGREGQAGGGPDPPSPAQARALLADGYTLGIRRAERHHPALGELADGFRHDLGAAVDIHVYCTPAGQPGFGWHYDAEDVFLLQLRGRKDWELRKNTVHPWPLRETLPADMQFERERMPLLRCALCAGDWLYLPGGYWHRGRAVEESVSLSVGLATATALDVYDFLRGRLRASLRWRQRLPVAGAAAAQSTDALVARYRALFAELGQDLAALLAEEELARAFLADRGRS